ncbi:MAG: hypothetical protein KDD33_01750 [Bdellovibrionales bacterium]|nr:hypothetical protein [Bdellovibrionales bacterium]
MKFAWALFIVLFNFQAVAGGLGAPYSLGSTAVLPKGIRSLSVGGIMSTVDTWYNDVSITSGVAEPFSLSLSYGRLLKAESDVNLKLNVESQLKAKGVSLDQIAGNSFADVNTRVVATVPVMAYGVSEKWTLAVAVPVVYFNMDVETGFVGTDQLQNLVTTFSKASRKQTQLIESKLRDVIQTEIANKGYKPLQDMERTMLGDVTLVAKYLAAKELNYSWSLTNRFVLPTAQVKDVAKVIDPVAGDGQFDYGIDSTVEVPINARWKMIQQTSYTIQFADTRETRVPVSESERLSTVVDYGARRDLGDMVSGAFGAQYQPHPSFSVAGSYTIGYKERDQWRGNQASVDRYNVLGFQTEQFMQAFFLQGAVSSIHAFQAKRFPIPFTASLGVGKVTDGRNIRNNPVWSFNMAMYF